MRSFIIKVKKKSKNAYFSILAFYTDSSLILFQELIWQIVNGVDLEAYKTHLFQRSPFLEMSMLRPGPLGPMLNKEEEAFKAEGSPANFVTDAEKMKGPRVIKTHLRMEFLPPNLLDTAKGTA